MLLRVALLFAHFTASLGDADPREWIRSTQRARPSFVSNIPGPASAARGERMSAGKMSSRAIRNDANCSEWYDMRVQLNRAMGQLQSEAQQPWAKEAARDLNCWLMYMLCQPELGNNSTEHRALLTNLRRISQLQKDNLRLRLEKVISQPSGRSRAWEAAENSEHASVLSASSGDVLQWEPPAPASTQQQLHVQGTNQRQRPAHEQRIPQQQPEVQPVSGVHHSVQTSMAHMMSSARPMIGRSGDEYAYHRRGPNLSARSAGPLIGATPQPLPFQAAEEGLHNACAVGSEGGAGFSSTHERESDSEDTDLDVAIARMSQVRDLPFSVFIYLSLSYLRALVAGS